MEIQKISDSPGAATRGASQASLVCPHCKRIAAKLDSCSQCLFERYCGKECQKACWPEHKPLCKLLKNASLNWGRLNAAYQGSPNPFWETKLHGGRLFDYLQENFSTQIAGKVAIDIGCGTGASSIYLLARGWKVIAIDYFKLPLQNLEALANSINKKWIENRQLEIIQTDIDGYQFPQGVDLILASDVFPYLDPLKLGGIWTKIFASLTDEGYLLGSFFDMDSTCTIFGAWTVDGIESVKNILTNGPYNVEGCRYRNKAHMVSSVIEFCARKDSKAKLMEFSPTNYDE